MTQTIEMKRDKECKGSVRFMAPEPQPGKPAPAVSNVYISRETPGANSAQSVKITVEIGG